MTEQRNYTMFDTPDILSVLFHPRRDFEPDPGDASFSDLLFEVPGGDRVAARFHVSSKNAPVIFFFHGNGEIASDYDDLAPIFTRLGINFMVFDYRGYGQSTGRPTVTHMMNDSTLLFSQARTLVKDKGYTGPAIVMGRSLGSASALEIASVFQDDVDAIIIESGFAYIMPLLNLLGLSDEIAGVNEENGPKNYEKITIIKKPTLVIHAEYDHIIPFSDGETLYRNSPAPDKTLLKIEDADHNTIFYAGLRQYMSAVETLSGKLMQNP